VDYGDDAIPASEETTSSRKPWLPYRDYGRSSKRTSTANKPFRRQSYGVVERRPWTLADSNGQRELVHVLGSSNPGEQAPRAEGVTIQTQEVEITYEGRRPRVKSHMMGHELSEPQRRSMITGQGR
jgi:hypothetical protein